MSLKILATSEFFMPAVNNRNIYENILTVLSILDMRVLFRHLVSIVALPVTVLIVLPIVLVLLFPSTPFWGTQALSLLFPASAGLLSLAFGFFILCSAASSYIKKGAGTIAPWDPTRNLIVTGFYAHVRNPMLEGVFLILTGESVIVGSVALAVWTLVFVVGNLLYVPLVEEPKLTERFGEEYLLYKRNVPRWVPRLLSRKPYSEH
jgi:protein-S-isoprenylcysteine O-methyltransferase Ste14